jgi:hypothetical protein
MLGVPVSGLFNHSVDIAKNRHKKVSYLGV